MKQTIETLLDNIDHPDKYPYPIGDAAWDTWWDRHGEKALRWAMDQANEIEALRAERDRIKEECTQYIDAKDADLRMMTAERDQLLTERDKLRTELEGVRRAARNISAINGELLAKSGKIYSREQNLDNQIEGVQAANAILTEENEKLRARVKELEEDLSRTPIIWRSMYAEAVVKYQKQFADHQAKHDARVTELLEANNREVERRRRAEAALRDHPNEPRGQEWFLWMINNPDAAGALVEGRAAVVPIRRSDLFDETHWHWVGEVKACRLDNPKDK